MLKVLRYFFYKIYSFSLSSGENDAGWAMTIVSLFTLANVYSLFDMILILFQLKLPQIEKPLIILFCGIVLYLNYILLMKNGKAKIILKEFNEMKQSKVALNLFLILYIVGSIVLVIYSMNAVRELNK